MSSIRRIRTGIIASGIGAAALAQPPTQLVPHEFHWSQMIHLFAQLGDIFSAGAAMLLVYLTYRLLQIELIKLQLDGPPSACFVPTTGRAVETTDDLEGLN
jgi:hypothetical protein